MALGGRQGDGADPHHRPLPHQGEERDRPVGEAHRRLWRQGAARRGRRWRRCPASAARPPTSCSTSPSASRPWRSTRTSSASPTAPASRPAATRWRWSWRWRSACPTPYRLHAHHWLILHGRYVCKARKPDCARLPHRRSLRLSGQDAVTSGRLRADLAAAIVAPAFSDFP